MKIKLGQFGGLENVIITVINDGSEVDESFIEVDSLPEPVCENGKLCLQKYNIETSEVANVLLDVFAEIKPTYEEQRADYLKRIQEAETLGETDEVTRLQVEWATIREGAVA